MIAVGLAERVQAALGQRADVDALLVDAGFAGGALVVASATDCGTDIKQKIIFNSKELGLKDLGC